jgi:uncharacterized delta-60 repeat protein
MLLLLGCMSLSYAQTVPSFTLQPVPQQAQAGHTIRLTASATPANSSLQWYHDDTLIPGGTGSVFLINNSQAEDTGRYTVCARLGNNASWSQEVFVSVLIPIPSPGILDHHFFTSQLSGDAIHAVLPLPDGRIAIGGEFSLSPQIRNIAILLADGSPDPNFTPTASPDGVVWALTVSQNRLIAAGDFTTVNGTNCSGIAALDLETGALSSGWDHSLGFVPGGIPVPRILTLVEAPNGKILAGGTFTRWRMPNGSSYSSPHLTRLNTNGTPDQTFATPAVSGEVRSIAMLDDGSIALGGSFILPYKRFCVLQENGQPHPNFALSNEPNLRVRSVLKLPDGSILIAGQFTNIGTRIARFTSTGTQLQQLNIAPNNTVNAMHTDVFGGVLLGGVFRTVSDIPMRYIARLNPDLTLDQTYRVDGLDDEISAIATTSDRILIAGDFQTPHPCLARLLATSDQPAGDIQLVISPSSLAATAGQPLDINVSTSPVRTGQTYIWTKNNQTIPNADTSSFRIDRPNQEDTGVYSVRVSDDLGTATSPPLGIKISPQLPGNPPHYRYRGIPAELAPNVETATSIFVSDTFQIQNIRVSVDLLHWQTRDLQLRLVSPAGVSVKLFNDDNNNSRKNGRNLTLTTFDDEAGGDLSVEDAQPPFTGTFRPIQLLSNFDSQTSTGLWSLRVNNQGPLVGALIDWALELWATPLPVTYPNFHAALNLPAGSKSRVAYALSQSGQFAVSHWRWSAPADCDYIYETFTPIGWQTVSPQNTTITRYPNSREFRQVRFPKSTNWGLFRLKAEFTD